MKIVVILPTYNERVNISKLIPVLEKEVFPKIKNHEMSILVVDDNSPDGTAVEAARFKKDWKNIYLLSGKKQGLGDAYVRGMKYAMDKLNADAVVEIDADFQHDPADIPRLVKAMDEGADYVIGSRYIEGGEIPKEWAIHRKLISRIGGLFAQVVLWIWHVHDMTSGYKLTKTSFLRHVDLDNLYSKYYAYKLHILHDVIRLKAKTKEVPIVFYERKEGSSKITRKDLFDSFRVVLKLRIMEAKRFVKFLVVGGTGYIVQIITQEMMIFLGIAAFIATFLATAKLIEDIPSVTNSIAAAFGAEAAIISNFLFNNFWTFDDTRGLKEKSRFIVRALRFNTASLGSIFLQALVVFLAVKFYGQTVTIFSYTLPTRLVVLIPFIIVFVIPLNYFLYNFVIWKTQYLTNKKRVAHSESI